MQLLAQNDPLEGKPGEALATDPPLSHRRQHHGPVTGLVFSLGGCGLYSSSASGSLAMYDTEHQDCRLLRLLGNTVARGTVFGPQALALSEDGKRLAFIGPLEFTVTVLDACSLDEVGADWVRNTHTYNHVDCVGMQSRKYESHACTVGHQILKE